MRRILPWALVGLLGASIGLGAWLGVVTGSSTASAQAWVSKLLTTTRAAGSARFTFSSVTTSTNPLLRSSSFGAGLVRFASGAVQVRETDRNETTSRSGNRAMSSTSMLEEVVLGHITYLRFSAPGVQLPSGVSGLPWIKVSTPTVGKSEFLGALVGTPASAALALLSNATDGLQMEELGSVTVDGTGATEYDIAPMQACTTASARGRLRESVSPTDLWVDGHGRLIQIRSAVVVTVPKGAVPGGVALAGRSRTVDVTRFADFGTPTKVTAPAVQRIAVGASVFGTATAEERCR